VWQLTVLFGSEDTPGTMRTISVEPLRLGQILVQARVVTDDVVAEALAQAGRDRQRLGQALVAMGVATVEDVLKAVAAQQALPYLSAEELPSTPPVLKELSPQYLRQSVACPIAIEGTTVTVATADPTDPLLLDELQQTLPLTIRLCVASEAAILEAIERAYGASTPLQKIVEGMGTGADRHADPEDDVDHLRDMAFEAPVVRLVNLLIEGALAADASDIHIEPFEDSLRVRYRVDGLLYDQEAPPRRLQAALTSRIKIMAEMNIAERRLAQDGRIRVTAPGGPRVDIRVSTVPTVHGESIVMRLLSRVLDSGCTPEEACQDSPELLSEVREQLCLIRSIDVQVEALFPGNESALMEEAGTPPRAVEALPQVPGHQMLSILGHGGMGIVYQARHVRLNRAVAVKMLLGSAHAHPGHLKRFLREAEAVAALRHPNIVQVHDVGDHDGLPYFTMELVEGGSLSQKLERTSLPAREAAALVAILAEAMEVAHARGIIHRDLKPANVLLTPDGVPKIVDFGLARRLEEDSSLTRTDAPVGTPSYMAPEQARGDSRAIGPAVDVYALGAILYAALTGRPPFRAETCAETLRQVVEDEPLRLSRLNRQVPRDLETICLKCLSKDPARRYSRAAVLADDLRRFLRGEPILARPAGTFERTAKWVRRRPAQATIAAGSVLGVMLLVGAGLWLGLQRAAIARATEEDLREFAQMAAASNWSQARTALERARARLAEEGASDQRRRLEQGARELAFVKRLDAIRLGLMAVAYGKVDRAFNMSKADSAYQQAFLDVGFEWVPGDSIEVAARVRSSAIRAALVSALDTWAVCAAADEGRRYWLLDVARLANPDPTGWRDSVRDPARWNDAAALTALTEKAPVGEESVPLLHALADRVILAGGDAVPFLTRVQQEHPDDFWSNLALGLVLSQRTPEDAIRYYQSAVAIRPDVAIALGNLGGALGSTGRIDEAIMHLRKAILLDPTLATSYANLGLCLATRGLHAQAAEQLGTAVHLDPSTAMLRTNLGRSLLETGRVDQAIDQLREAVRLEPRSGKARFGLGFALHATGLLDEAIEQLRRAIEIEPRYYAARESLGHVFKAMGRIDEAIASFREAVRLNPGHPPSSEALIEALIARGLFDEAQTEARRYLERCPTGDARRGAAQDQLRHCDVVAALEVELPAIRDGARLPLDGAECLAFADFFRGSGDQLTAAHYFADAFARSTGTPRDGGRWRTFDAARCAAMAGLAAENSPDLRGDEERKRLRTRTLAWLREEKAALEAMLTAAAPGAHMTVLHRLVDWQADPALAGLRDIAGIERLCEDERAQWRTFWSEVDALSTRARSDD